MGPPAVRASTEKKSFYISGEEKFVNSVRERSEATVSVSHQVMILFPDALHGDGDG